MRVHLPNYSEFSGSLLVKASQGVSLIASSLAAPQRPSATADRRAVLRFSVPVAAVLLVDLALVAYYGSFRGAFFLDDVPHIIENPTIRSLTATWATCREGPRPLLFLSLAGNYAIGGVRPFGYHVFNFLVHVTAGLALLGIVRRSLIRNGTPENSALGPAFAVALLWTVHPLQTQSVTYIIQRGESMMGMCYLLLLYLVIRSDGSRRPWLWQCAALTAGLAGFGCKEVMVTAPLVVALYDRTFLATSWSEILKRRGWLYAVLGAVSATMILRAVLTPNTQADVSAGFGFPHYTPWQYLWTQASVIVYYLRLCFWPWPLCLDYMWPIARSAGPAIIPGLLLLGLVAISVAGMVRRRWWGWLGVAFFLILAPTSSIMPIADTAAEHRMYLPLAAVVAVVVLLVNHSLDLIVPAAGTRRVLKIALLALATGVLIALTWERNRDYQDAVRMWSSVVRVAPHNPRAQLNLGIELGLRGESELERRQYERALEIHAGYPKAHLNLGVWYAEHDQRQRAVEHYREAIRLQPRYAKAYTAWGNLLAREGELREALQYYRRSLEIEPNLAAAHLHASQAYYELGQHRPAAWHLRRVVDLAPEIRAARRQLAWILATSRDASLRDGHSALALAAPLTATESTARAEELDTLAAAQAACGQFDRAVGTAREAIHVARRAGLEDLAEKIEARLTKYRHNRPWIQ